MAQGALRFLSLGTNVISLTTGETVRFVVLLTHTSGADKIVGGQISSPDGKTKYTSFTNDGRPGSFSADLTWTQINQAVPAGFATEEKRQFLIEFFDVNGDKGSQTLELRLHCSGDPACKGMCLKTASLCPGSTTDICVAGTCSNGCFIDGALRAPMSTNPDANFGTCQSCDTNMSRTMWTSAMAGVTCGTGLACVTGGQCNKAFTQTGFAPGVALNDLWGSSANDVWALGPLTTAYRSTDGGKTWGTITLPGSIGRTAIWGAAATSVYVVGAMGTVIQSSTSGVSWNSLPTGSAQTLRGIWGTAADNIYVVGDAGTIYRTTNGGLAWTNQSTGTNPLYGITGTGINNVIAVGANGTILRSINSTNWTTVQSTVTVTLYAARAVAMNSIWAVGQNGTVLTSPDGATWTKLTFPATSVNAVDVWGVDGNDVYVATTNSVYRTTDGGQSWKQLYVPNSPSTLSALYGFSASDLYVSGFNYVAHHP
jgi:photosystem II stability/assembly factor-like uncharacterized protein